jgi:hypothetical protein
MMSLDVCPTTALKLTAASSFLVLAAVGCDVGDSVGPGLSAAITTVSPSKSISVSSALTTARGPWTKISEDAYRLHDSVESEPVGLRVQTSGLTVAPRMAEITRDAVDLRVPGNGQNGPGAVGLLLGNRGSAQVPIWVDTGDVMMEDLGAWAKVMPVVIETPYVYFNGRGTVNPTSRYASVVIPHTGMGSDGPVQIGWVATLYTDGAPDVNPDLSTDSSLPGGGQYSIYVGGDFCDLGDGIVWGQGRTSSAGYEDVATGAAAPVSENGHIRRRYNESSDATKGFEVSIDGGNYIPLPVAMQYFTNYMPESQSYSAGETVVHTVKPTDAGYKGLRSIDPKRWTLPAAVAIPGGQLISGIRFWLGSTGSSQLLQNVTEADVSTGRDSVFLALVGSWITEVRLVVINTSGATAVGSDVGNFQFEASVF